MFDALKQRMMLDESRAITNNALSLILEEMNFDDDIEEAMVLESSYYEDDDIEAYLNEIPDDEDDDEEDMDDIDYYDREMGFLESFIDGEHNHYSSVDMDSDLENECGSSSYNNNDDLDSEDGFNLNESLINNTDYLL